MNTSYESFGKAAEAFGKYRPSWPLHFAKSFLAINSLVPGRAIDQPIILCLGVGTGADAAPFLKLGCEVLLVDPDQKMLDQARVNLASIKTGKATFITGRAGEPNIPVEYKRRIDGVIMAQANHAIVLKGEAEAARQWLGEYLRDPSAPCVSVWNYNPEVSRAIVVLDQILKRELPAYRESLTPFIQAAAFGPNFVQPLVDAAEMIVSPLDAVDTIALKGGASAIADWLSTYSFAPKDPVELKRVADVLEREWFQRFAPLPSSWRRDLGEYRIDGRSEGDDLAVFEMRFVGRRITGPLRSQAFEGDVAKLIPVKDPLDQWDKLKSAASYRSQILAFVNRGWRALRLSSSGPAL